MTKTMKMTARDRIANARVNDKWDAWRAKAIADLMKDGTAYAEAVKQSRRAFKRNGAWR
jgi:hypothetical protein